MISVIWKIQHLTTFLLNMKTPGPLLIADGKRSNTLKFIKTILDKKVLYDKTKTFCIDP